MYKFTIIAHKGIKEQTALDATEIIINAKNEQEALAHARKLHKSAGYFVRRIEYLDIDGQRGFQEEIIKAMKKCKG